MVIHNGLQFDFQEDFKMAASHGTGEDGDVLGVPEVVDDTFDGGTGAAPVELSLQGEVRHIIRSEAACDVGNLIAGGRVALAVGVPEVGQLPGSPACRGGDVGRVARHIDELLAVGRVGLVEVLALIDGGCEGIVSREGNVPVCRQLQLCGEVGL